MENTTVKFIVTEHPPWYLTSDYKDVFSCESTQGLFYKVANLMLCKQDELSEREKRYKPQNIHKAIKNMVIHAADSIEQKPSRSLLLALMDLVDSTGGNNLDSVDMAGHQHTLLASENYTAFYIPNKELVDTNGKKVIPVVTQYSENDNFAYYDSIRSMIGTYTVEIPTAGDSERRSYFVQEALFVPGLKSLELLKGVTANTFDFWDMTLEVPTHFTALTPSFQLVKPYQLLRTEIYMPWHGTNDALKEIQPMCCVLEKVSALKNKRETSIDCFTEPQVKYDLKHFCYTNGASPTVYIRRGAVRMKRERCDMTLVVAVKTGQIQAPELYVSTTVRFCRAVKRSRVQGSGGIVSCWNAILNNFERDTFITGTYMDQEIHNQALTVFTKRVNPKNWCNYLPKHVQSIMEDPLMIEVVELAIRFMDSKIPNAFAVAELLYCPIEKVQEYLKFWNVCASDTTIRTTATRKLVSLVKEHMQTDWAALAEVASSYSRKRYGDKGHPEMVLACEELFKNQTLYSIAKIQKMWQVLVKHDTSKIKDKELIHMYANANVLFLKLRIYHKKLNKLLKVRARKRCNQQSGSFSAEAQDANVSPNGLAEHSGDHAMAAGSKKNDKLDNIVTPECIRISTWVKNMSTLLLSKPWLDNENIRREAVCTLLGLDNTLLSRCHRHILCDWVIDNETVVTLLQQHGLQDRLSKALVHCLESTSTVNWRRKILLAFPGTQDKAREYSDQNVAKTFNAVECFARRRKRDRGGKRDDNMSADIKSPKSKWGKMAQSSPSHNSHSVDDKCIQLSKTKGGEDSHDYSIESGKNYINTLYYSSDPQDYNVNIKDEYNSEEEMGGLCAQVKRRAKMTKGKRKCMRVSHSESKDRQKYKQALQCDFKEDFKCGVKHLKYAKGDHQSAKHEKKHSRSGTPDNETLLQHLDREYVTEERQDRSAKRCKRVKHSKNRGTSNRDSLLSKRQLFSDEDNEEDKLGGELKWDSPSNIKCTSSPLIQSDTNCEQNQTRPPETPQKGRPDNTPSQTLQNTKLRRSLDQQELSINTSQSFMSSVEATNTFKVVWPTDTLQYIKPSNQEREGECDREKDCLYRADRLEPISDESNLDNNCENSSSDPETESGEFIFSM